MCIRTIPDHLLPGQTSLKMGAKMGLGYVKLEGLKGRKCSMKLIVKS